MRMLSRQFRPGIMTTTLLLAALLLIAGCPQSSGSEQTATSAGSGTSVQAQRPPAPAFNYSTLGGLQRSTADFRGKPLVVNFFATT